jgi:hypothetical protein
MVRSRPASTILRRECGLHCPGKIETGTISTPNAMSTALCTDIRQLNEASNVTAVEFCQTQSDTIQKRMVY